MKDEMSPQPTRTVHNGFFNVTFDEYKALSRLPRETLVFINGANWIRIHHDEELFVMRNEGLPSIIEDKALPKFREIVDSFWSLKNPDSTYGLGVNLQPIFYRTSAHNLDHAIRFIEALLSAGFKVYLQIMTEESKLLHNEEILLKPEGVKP